MTPTTLTPPTAPAIFMTNMVLPPPTTLMNHLTNQSNTSLLPSTSPKSPHPSNLWSQPLSPTLTLINLPHILPKEITHHYLPHPTSLQAHTSSHPHPLTPPACSITTTTPPMCTSPLPPSPTTLMAPGTTSRTSHPQISSRNSEPRTGRTYRRSGIR